MTFEELSQLHMRQLLQSFGVANSQAVAKDNKLIRAFGMEQ